MDREANNIVDKTLKQRQVLNTMPKVCYRILNAIRQWARPMSALLIIASPSEMVVEMGYKK